MSAFVVSENHIRAIVTGYLDMLARQAACREHEDCRATLELGIACARSRRVAGDELVLPDATALGQMLWEECYRSVNLRYVHRAERAECPAYVHARVELSPIALFKTVGCYGYQSCEHEGWLESEACKIADRLEAWLVMTYGTTHDSPGYDAAPWGIR